MRLVNFVLCAMGYHKWKYKKDGTRKKCSRCSKRLKLSDGELDVVKNAA